MQTTDGDEALVQSKNMPVIYVDGFRIGHDTYKFVLDLGSLTSVDDTPKFQVRVVMGPDNARIFADTLAHSIQEWERQSLAEHELP